MDDTHDPGRRSWLPSANTPATDFPIQNLPLGLFRRPGLLTPRVGVAIGDSVLDVRGCQEADLLTGDADDAGRACVAPYAQGVFTPLNALAALGRRHWTALRRRISDLLADRVATDQERARVSGLLVRMSDVEMLLPVRIGDYTDFYASIDHATNVGRLFRPDSPLLPNYRWVPIGYHGRASSIVVTGTDVRRPGGQMRPSGSAVPRVAPTERLDYELEVGCFIGPGNQLGSTIPIGDAESQMFGLCLVNDWSARDIQQWEYQPLGPFLAKSFATTISPWVVTLDALEPFRVAAAERPPDDPQPLPYLDSAGNRAAGGVALMLEVGLRTAAMRARGDSPAPLTRSSFARMYWTFAQMITHHASNGCNLQPGDLLASGTVSGPSAAEQGCLLELTRGGTEPIPLPGGETRAFLQDGDEVILRGWCSKPGFARIGFGECMGTILPAPGL